MNNNNNNNKKQEHNNWKISNLFVYYCVLDVVVAVVGSVLISKRESQESKSDEWM